MLILKFLHIVSMFSGVTLAVGSLVFLDLVARTRDVDAYRRLDAIVQRTDMAAVALFLAGIAFGFLTAITGGFDLTASWLILAYVLVAAIVVEGLVFSGPWFTRIREAASQADRTAAAAEVQRLIRNPKHLAALANVNLLFVAIIYVMVVKPTLF
jgi:hypothetical protein